MRLQFRAPARRLSGVVLVALAGLLAACSSSPRNTINAVTGTASGVSIATSTGSTVLVAGGVMTLTASVFNDPKSQGVTWTLDGPGTLSNITSTSVDYTAPTGFAGVDSPIVTATSVVDATQLGQLTLLVNGNPYIDPATVLFPGNLNLAYGGSIVAQGGTLPLTWSVSAGALPPGITLSTSTTNYTALTGTPTALGTYAFTILVTDAAGATASVDLTLTIQPATACLLTGQFALLETGFVTNRMTVGAASYNISSTGAITGYQDYGYTTAVAESITGTCTNRTGNNGTLTLAGTQRSPVFNYAVNIALANGRAQLMNGGDSTITAGQLAQQDPSAFSLAALAGDYAFGALGSYPPGAAGIGVRAGVAGRLTLGATGAVSNGRMDANTSTPLTAATFSTGSFSAPDANGRGTLKFTAGGLNWQFTYYVVNASRIYIVATDPTGSTPQLAGFLTRQFGSFDRTSLGTQGIVSLWGAEGQDPPHAVLAMGRLGGADTTAGTVGLVLDTAAHAGTDLDKIITGAAYTVAADGRATLSYADGTSTRQFVLYLDGVDDGYLVEPGSSAGTAGLLEAQVAGPYPITLPGLFVYGTQFAEDSGPITLLPQMQFSSSAFSSGSGLATGNIALDTTNGRGQGLLSITGSGSTVVASYEVSPGQIRILRFGARLTAPVIEFMGD